MKAHHSFGWWFEYFFKSVSICVHPISTWGFPQIGLPPIHILIGVSVETIHLGYPHFGKPPTWLQYSFLGVGGSAHHDAGGPPWQRVLQRPCSCGCHGGAETAASYMMIWGYPDETMENCWDGSLGCLKLNVNRVLKSIVSWKVLWI